MLVAFCSFMLSGCTTNVKEYVIKGSVAWGNPDVYLTTINENGKLDTIQHVVPVNGKFEMKGNLSEPKISFLVVKDGKGRIPLLLQDTILRVVLKLMIYLMSGILLHGAVYYKIGNRFWTRRK